MSICKHALYAIIAATINIGGMSAPAMADTPAASQPATNTPDTVDPCLRGVPIDQTVVDSHGRPAAPTTPDCVIASIPWGAHR